MDSDATTLSQQMDRLMTEQQQQTPIEPIEQDIRHKAEMTRAVPVLPAMDVKETTKFYVEKLGFHVTGDYGNYVLLQRDYIELHLWHGAEKLICENSGCYLRVANVEELHKEFSEKGVKMRTPLEIKEWGMHEFAVCDNDGNLLRFGEPPAK